MGIEELYDAIVAAHDEDNLEHAAELARQLYDRIRAGDPPAIGAVAARKLCTEILEEWEARL